MNLQDDMNDWWDEHKRQEEEIQQLEVELIKIREEVSRMRVEPQQDFDLINDTCLKGYVRATFDELVAAFGEPLDGDGDKTQAEWVLLFTLPDGDEIVATVYDWKKYDTPPMNIMDWNIGGRDYRAPEVVIDYLNYVRDMEEQQVAVAPMRNADKFSA
jgi:hypothetical protein